ncbi:sn-1-specific diacylglycerol lipase [Entamoeba marina]
MKNNADVLGINSDMKSYLGCNKATTVNLVQQLDCFGEKKKKVEIDLFLNDSQNNYSRIISSTVSSEGVETKDIIRAMHTITKERVENPMEGIIREVNNYDFLHTLHFYMKLCVVSYGKWLYLKMAKEDNFFKRIITAKSKYEVDWRFAKSYGGIDRDKFVSAQWDSTDYNPAHYMAILDSKKTIVIVNRGSLSMEDAKIDLSAKPIEYSFNGIQGFTHAGIYRSCLNKYEQLCPILHFMGKKYPTYKLIVTGHSLGGGIAQLLTLEIYKRHPEWNVHCYSFAPACVLSTSIANDPLVKQLISSVVSNNDIVPRLSYRSAVQFLKYTHDVKQIHDTTHFFHMKTKTTNDKLKRAFFNYYQTTRNEIDDALIPGGNVYQLITAKNDKIKTTKCYLKENKEYGWLLFQNGSFTDHMPDSYEKLVGKAFQCLM